MALHGKRRLHPKQILRFQNYAQLDLESLGVLCQVMLIGGNELFTVDKMENRKDELSPNPWQLDLTLESDSFLYFNSSLQQILSLIPQGPLDLEGSLTMYRQESNSPVPPNRQTFGDLIKVAIQQAVDQGVIKNQFQLAQEMGISPGLITGVIQNQKLISPDNLKCLLECLRLPLDQQKILYDDSLGQAMDSPWDRLQIRRYMHRNIPALPETSVSNENIREEECGKILFTREASIRDLETF